MPGRQLLGRTTWTEAWVEGLRNVVGTGIEFLIH